MEDDKVSAPEASSENIQTKKIGEVFDELCAFYMSIGVSYDEFWFGDYTRLKYYVKAWELKQERDSEEANFRLYLAGLYNFNAFSSVIGTFAWGLGGKRGSKPEGYLEAPIAFTENEKRAEKERNTKKTLDFFMKGQKEK